MIDRIQTGSAWRCASISMTARGGLVALSLGTLLACGRGEVTPHQYAIDVGLDPASQTIEAEASLRFIAPEEGMGEAVFHLHRQLEVSEISGEKVSGWTIEATLEPVAFMPEARRLRLTFAEPLSRGEATTIRFAYEGAVTEWPAWSANVITEEWVELGLYLPWFPANLEYGLFTYEIGIDVDPSYEVRGVDGVGGEGSAHRIVGTQPTNDIVVVASRRLETTELDRAGRTVEVHSLTWSQGTVEALAEDFLSAAERYSEWFGRGRSERMVVIESARRRGGGYARPGLIVLTGVDDDRYRQSRETYAQQLAHEAAHGWWRNAPTDTWEDWLNEGFAEYVALLVVRERFGEEVFEARISGKLEQIWDIPAIWGFDRSDPALAGIARTNLYDRAPTLLYRLSDRIGEPVFLDLCRELVAKRVDSTERFLERLEERTDEETAAWFEQLLRTP